MREKETQRKNFNFPSPDWYCHLCTNARKTPKGLISMNIKSARKAIKRYNVDVANGNQREDKKRMQNLIDAQAACPDNELIEVTSTKETIRTAELSKLFNGPWLQHDPTENKLPANITVWRRVEAKLRPQGPARADLTGMLDTARQTCWERIRATTPSADKPQDTELLRRANAWNSYENPLTQDIDNPETKADHLLRKVCEFMRDALRANEATAAGETARKAAFEKAHDEVTVAIPILKKADDDRKAKEAAEAAAALAAETTQ
jgi:hypothetical protein